MLHEPHASELLIFFINFLLNCRKAIEENIKNFVFLLFPVAFYPDLCKDNFAKNHILLLMIITKKNKSNREKSEKRYGEEEIVKFYNVLFALFYCSTRKDGTATTSITYKTIQKWSCLTFYDVKKYLDVAQNEQMIFINREVGSPRMEITIRKELFEFLCESRYNSRNFEFVRDNLENTTGPLNRFVLYYLAGRVTYDKRPRFEDRPVRVYEIVKFLSKFLIFYKDERGRKRLRSAPYNFGEIYPEQRGLEKKVREVLRKFGAMKLTLSERIPEHLKSENEKYHRNEKYHMLNITKYCLMKSAYIFSSSKEEDSFIEKNISQDEKKIKKEKNENEEENENKKPKKRKSKLGRKKFAIGNRLIKQSVEDFLIFAKRISKNDNEKIFHWFRGALFSLTQAKCENEINRLKPAIQKRSDKREEKNQKFCKIKGYIFCKKIWRSFKQKSNSFFDFFIEKVEQVKSAYAKFKKKGWAFEQAFPETAEKYRNLFGLQYVWFKEITRVEKKDNEVILFFNKQLSLDWLKNSLAIAWPKHFAFCLELPKVAETTPKNLAPQAQRASGDGIFAQQKATTS